MAALARCFKRLLAAALLVFAALFVAGGVHAQDAPEIPYTPATDAPPVADGSLGDKSLKMVTALFGAINKGIKKIANNAWGKDLATKIAVVLLALVAVWSYAKNLLLGKGIGGLMAELFPAMIMFGLALAAMSADLGMLISKSVDVITANYLGPVKDGGALGIMANLCQHAFSLFDLEPLTYPGALNVAGWVVVGFGYLAKLVAAVILLVCAAFAAAAYLIAEISVAIACGLGPVLYVWAIWRPTEWIFNSWLKFLICAAMQKLMLSIMASLVGSVIAAVSSELAPKLLNVSADFIAYGGILLIAMIAVHLMKAAPGMATMLLSGHGGLSLHGWQAASQSARDGAQSAATGANNALGSAIGGAVDMYQAVAAKSGDGQQGQGNTGGGGQSPRPKTATQWAMQGAKNAAGAVGTLMKNAMGPGQEGGGDRKKEPPVQFPPIVPPGRS